LEEAQVAAGSHPVARPETAVLPVGWVVTASGRLSVATDPENLPDQYPFRAVDLVMLDDALTQASRQSKARFAVYIGDLGADTAARARNLLADVPTSNNAVLLAVSPDQRAIEVAYGADLLGRGIDSAAPLGVAAAASSFREGEGNLIDGLISAVRVMSAAISRP
jgi:hypothetical protein